MANVLIEESTMQAIGNSIRGKNGSTTTYLPSEMPAAIDAIETDGGMGSSIINRSAFGSSTQNLAYLCYGGRVFPGVTEIVDDTELKNDLQYCYSGWNSNPDILNTYTKVTNVKDISSLEHAFYASSASYSLDPDDVDDFVENCIELREGGTISATNYEYMFYCCPITKIPSWFKAPKTATSWNSTMNVRFSDMFYNAVRIEKIDFAEMGFPAKYYTQQAYVLLRNGFNANYFLREVKSVPLYAGTSNLNPTNSNVSSYIPSSAFTCFPRLRVFTLPNCGTLGIYNLNLNFSKSGYYYTTSSSVSNLWFYPSDKRITDAASYAALKNDPAAWTTDRTYSFFNHNSVVELINSAPDMSGATGGTNTFTFYSDQGANTDGGAIGNLTDTEIAAATAKNITIALL